MADFLDVQMFRCSPIVCFILNIKHSWKLKQWNMLRLLLYTMLKLIFMLCYGYTCKKTLWCKDRG